MCIHVCGYIEECMEGPWSKAVYLESQALDLDAVHGSTAAGGVQNLQVDGLKRRLEQRRDAHLGIRRRRGRERPSKCWTHAIHKQESTHNVKLLLIAKGPVGRG